MNLIKIMTGIEMFSLEHILATLTCILIILIVFFSRKFFMTHHYADLSFRIIIALALISSEVIITIQYIVPKTGPLVLLTVPRPLCGMLLWTCAIALLSNSTRLMRKFYPLFLTGASLSLIMCEIPEANFPSFRAFQYFICHGGFLLGALYFVFTRKINKFTFKDYGYSCVILAFLGGMMSFLYATNKNIFPDDFYVMGTGMEAFKDIYDACGQIGYSLIYMVSITAIMAIFATITYFLTRKRDDNENKPIYYKNKVFTFLKRKTSNKARYITLLVLYTAFLYMISWQAEMAQLGVNGIVNPLLINDPAIITMGIILGIYWFIMLFVATINEIMFYYKGKEI